MGRNPVDTAIAIADAATWYLALTLVAVILLTSLRSPTDGYSADAATSVVVRGKQFGMAERRCEEIYVVGEGETLHTISDRCGDPYIVEQNPHIHDPDDVFPGLVIKITPSLSL